MKVNNRLTALPFIANAHGDANSDAAIQNASHVTGANSVAIVSGGDTNVISSQIAGRQIAADVGGNLNIASVQDTTVSAAHQSSTGGGFTIILGGGGEVILPGPIGRAFDTSMQILPGPAQAVIENNSKKDK